LYLSGDCSLHTKSPEATSFLVFKNPEATNLFDLYLRKCIVSLGDFFNIEVNKSLEAASLFVLE
jgi:hypothetical protein